MSTNATAGYFASIWCKGQVPEVVAGDNVGAELLGSSREDVAGGAEGFAVVVAHKPRVVEGASDERESVEGVGWFHGLAMRCLPVKVGFEDALAAATLRSARTRD